MPTYDYFCEECSYEAEIFHSMKDTAHTFCPQCGKQTLKRRIGTGAGLLFKGTGFYETDYKNPKSEKKTDIGASKKEACAPKAACSSSE